MMTEQEIEKYHQKMINSTDVKIGDIFYSADNPENKYEVLNYVILGHGLYFYIGCFNTLDMRLCKNVELYKDSTYLTYFRTSELARKQLIKNKQKEIASIEELIKQLGLEK